MALKRGHSFVSQIANVFSSEKQRGSEVTSVSSTDPHKLFQTDPEYRLVELPNHDILVEFAKGSTADPTNWAFSKKVYNILTALFVVLNSGISASLPSMAVPAITQEFDQTSNGAKVLPSAVFLIGYVVGPLLFSPLSETIGRKPVLFWSFSGFVLATLGCAFAPTWESFLVLRSLCGLMAAAPQTIVGGVYADMFSDIRQRGRAMCFYMSAASFGPILGPIISGCAVQYGWRWVFRIDVILSGSCWIGLCFMPETFAPVILKKQAAKLRKMAGSSLFLAPSELETSGVSFTTTQILTRPIMMLVFEPIILSTAIYISIAYSLVFFFFQAYPIIFEGTYNFNVQSTSLTYIPIGIGAASSGLLSLYWDTVYEKAKKQGKAWTTSPELHRLPISCLAGPCLTTALFWLAWSAKANVHWMAPVMSGLLFGFGYQIIFISLLTYVTDAYKIYSASALAASVIMRSVAGAVFPLTAHPLYNALDVAWATSVLAFASLACIPIPLVLLYAGPWIREHSAFCQHLGAEESPKQQLESRMGTPAEV